MKDRTPKPAILPLKEAAEAVKASARRKEPVYQTSSFQDADLDCLPRLGITIVFTKGAKPSCWAIG